MAETIKVLVSEEEVDARIEALESRSVRIMRENRYTLSVC